MDELCRDCEDGYSPARCHRMAQAHSDALEAADALAHAVRDMLTHDLSAGSVLNVENARKRYEALRPRNAPPLRPAGDESK